MTKSMNHLTDTHIRNAQPKEKMYTLNSPVKKGLFEWGGTF